VTAGDDQKIVVRRRINATPEELFDAWLDPEGMKEWMCPGHTVRTDVKLEPHVGGSMLIIMHSAAESYEHQGEFTVIERPRKLSFTWRSKATAWENSLVTVEFIEVSVGESEMILTHGELPSKDVADQHRGGWGQIVERMTKYLKGVSAERRS
jgi:uncharacterized protein YndB with AHSA1/START domain